MEINSAFKGLIICDKIYFVRVHLLVLLHEFKYSVNAQMLNILDGIFL